jgi:hypothetical protein
LKVFLAVSSGSHLEARMTVAAEVAKLVQTGSVSADTGVPPTDSGISIQGQFMKVHTQTKRIGKMSQKITKVHTVEKEKLYRLEP